MSSVLAVREGSPTVVGEDGRGRRFEERIVRLEAEIAGLHKALQTRTVIGQATGLIAVIGDRTPTEAFDLLVRMSQHDNVKLQVAARQLVAAYEATHGSNPPGPDARAGQLLWERLSSISTITNDSAGT
jgi:hypothetical protein